MFPPQEWIFLNTHCDLSDNGGGGDGLTKIPDQVSKQTWKLIFKICDKGF